MKDKRTTECKTERKKERKKEWSNSAASNAAPKPQALSPLHPTTSIGWELPDLSGRQDVHHRLVALFYGKELRDLHVPASARSLARIGKSANRL
jgi:hypothetical protein